MKRTISGDQGVSSVNSPIEALQQFYAAFNGRDMAQMADNWASLDSVTMSNPLGGIKRGWDEIRMAYESIFAGDIRVYVEFYDYEIIEAGNMFCAMGREKGYFRSDDAQLDLAIRTSRIFNRVEARWKQVHHHGSIDDPELLRAYQQAVLKRRKVWQGGKC